MRPVLAVVVGALVVAGTIAVTVIAWRDEVAGPIGGKPVTAPPSLATVAPSPAAGGGPTTLPSQAEPAGSAPPSAADAASAPLGPRVVANSGVADGSAADRPWFDVVRVNPRGDTVVAGRAQPRSTVGVFDGERELGRAQADDHGEWVFVPPEPLPPGSRRLSLAMRPPDAPPDAPPVLSDDAVVLVVPLPAASPAASDDSAAAGMAPRPGPLAVKVPRAGTGPSRVLQRPDGPPATDALLIEAVDYDDDGNLSIGGHAGPGVRLHLYLDNGFLGATEAGTDGYWLVIPDRRVGPGLYTLRVDQIDPDGAVTARVNVPFARAEPLTDAQSVDFAIVQPGQNLWRIARGTYGTGVRYTTIFEANRNQIANPDRIFPGQIITLPRAD